MTDRLFAYGTLRPIARRRGGRSARVYGRLWENGHYPGARLGEPDGPMIAGLVFEVTAEDLASFDAREGVAHNWYRRVRTHTVGGETVWVYEADRCLTDDAGVHRQWRLVKPDRCNVAEWRDRGV